PQRDPGRGHRRRRGRHVPGQVLVAPRQQPRAAGALRARRARRLPARIGRRPHPVGGLAREAVERPSDGQGRPDAWRAGGARDVEPRGERPDRGDAHDPGPRARTLRSSATSTTMGSAPKATLTTDRRPRPVVRAARFAVAHVPGLVLAGSKPRRDIAAGGAETRAALRRALRSFQDAVGYPPHQVLLGTLAPEALREIPRPWHLRPLLGARPAGPGGAMIDEFGFYAWLARADTARLVHFAEDFAEELRPRLGDAAISTK